MVVVVVAQNSVRGGAAVRLGRRSKQTLSSTHTEGGVRVGASVSLGLRGRGLVFRRVQSEIGGLLDDEVHGRRTKAFGAARPSAFQSPFDGGRSRAPVALP